MIEAGALPKLVAMATYTFGKVTSGTDMILGVATDSKVTLTTSNTGDSTAWGDILPMI